MHAPTGRDVVPRLWLLRGISAREPLALQVCVRSYVFLRGFRVTISCAQLERGVACSFQGEGFLELASGRAALRGSVARVGGGGPRPAVVPHCHTAGLVRLKARADVVLLQLSAATRRLQRAFWLGGGVCSATSRRSP